MGKEFMYEEKLYEEYAHKFDNVESAVYLALYLAGARKEFLAYKFHVPYEKVEYVGDSLFIGPDRCVYHELMKVKDRTKAEETYCRNVTTGFIICKINYYVKMARDHNLDLLKNSKKLKMYMSLSPEEIRVYADKVVKANVDREGHLKVGIHEISF